jgi:hypothetical protein
VACDVRMTTALPQNDGPFGYFTSGSQPFYFGFWGSFFQDIRMNVSCDDARSRSFAYLFGPGKPLLLSWCCLRSLTAPQMQSLSLGSAPVPPPPPPPPPLRPPPPP